MSVFVEQFCFVSGITSLQIEPESFCTCTKGFGQLSARINGEEVVFSIVIPTSSWSEKEDLSEVMIIEFGFD